MNWGRNLDDVRVHWFTTKSKGRKSERVDVFAGCCLCLYTQNRTQKESESETKLEKENKNK